MRAIIIDDKDARALLDALKIEAMNQRDMEGAEARAITERLHSKFHYVVTRWLQEQGASVTR